MIWCTLLSKVVHLHVFTCCLDFGKINSRLLNGLLIFPQTCLLLFGSKLLWSVSYFLSIVHIVIIGASATTAATASAVTTIH